MITPEEHYRLWEIAHAVMKKREGHKFDPHCPICVEEAAEEMDKVHREPPGISDKEPSPEPS